MSSETDPIRVSAGVLPSSPIGLSMDVRPRRVSLSGVDIAENAPVVAPGITSPRSSASSAMTCISLRRFSILVSSADSMACSSSVPRV